MRGRIVVLAVLAVTAVSVGGLIGRLSVAPAATTATTTGEVSPPPDVTVAVHVSGMVLSPGVVHIPSDAIVADAIDAAGGLRPGALVERINLAAPVAPGDQIVVPGPDEEEPGAEASGEGPLSLNRATATELESLPGVGPVLAERIVSFRESNGRFDVVEDLLEVTGIGEAKLGAIRDLVMP